MHRVPRLQALAAVGAQAGAVRLAQGRDRLGQADRRRHQGAQLQLVVVGQPRRLGVGAFLGRNGQAAREVDRGQDLLVDPQLHGRGQLAEAACALAGDGRRQAGVHDQPAVGAQQTHAPADGLGEHQVLAGVHVDARDLVLAHGPGRLGHEPGDGERQRIAVGIDRVRLTGVTGGHRRPMAGAPVSTRSSSASSASGA